MEQDKCIERISKDSAVKTRPFARTGGDVGEIYSTVIVGDDNCIGKQLRSISLSHHSFVSKTFTSSGTEFALRALDVVGSLLMLAFFMPLFGVIFLLVKISSPGPIFYKQERVGKNGRIFTMYKFRTMINNAEELTGPVLAGKNDNRVTPIGRFLRVRRLDELPQLFNVLRGDMSLVGPRPERPHFVNQHEVLRGIRLAVKPGLTGLAQVQSFYDLRPLHKAKYDSLYIQNRSLLFNLYILSKTIPVLFTKNGW